MLALGIGLGFIVTFVIGHVYAFR